MTPKVGVILVNYKDYAQKYLAPCFASLRKQTYPAEPTHIFIVDNAATPVSQEFLKKHCPEAIVLARPDGNYAAANNLGARAALSAGCAYLVMANMDTEMEAEWLNELVKALDKNPEAGLAQSKILLYPKTAAGKARPKINSLGNIFHFLGFGFTSAYGEEDRELAGYPEITGYASGCAFIIRAALFEKIGGYNEDYYMYHDDTELSLKAKLTGAKIILAPRSVIYHKYEFQRHARDLYYQERNRRLVLLAFYPLYLLLLVFPAAFFMDLGLFFFSFFGGWLKTELKICAYFSCPAHYLKICRARRRLKKIAVMPFSRLAKNFSGRIEFQEINNPLLKYLVNPAFNFYWRVIKKII